MALKNDGSAGLKDPLGLDRQSTALLQGELAWDEAVVGQGRLRIRTVVTLRWWLLSLQGAGLVLESTVQQIPAPYAICFGMLGLIAWLNLLVSHASPGQRLLHPAEAALQLGFDVVWIAGLAALTGGIVNPFVILVLPPLALAAATLPFRPTAVLGAVAAGALLVVSVLAPPLADMGTTDYAFGGQLAALFALLLAMGITTTFVREAAQETARRALALDVTQAVLARERRLSALGGLAAAAAHELGTPLATIAIVAKEMAREATDAQVREDAELLMAQAQRCREILARLTQTPGASDEVHERMSLLQLLQEVIEPHRDVKGVRLEAIVTGAPGAGSVSAKPAIKRMPEVVHAISSFVENAVDFAASEVLVTARFDADTISLEVRDDGPGIAPEILARLGEPYVTSRPGAEGSRTGHVGMGLGFFISKTLLERTGAKVSFQNGRPRGAVVSVRWPRSRIESGRV
ncbi:MAG: ActS/PrrB/RegB family redox-sensitive histidine kinase [Phenylobacterium sp.]|uniref:ActS/PrrB/RegB family redox-sensitive histidine kinase n=1 Tax=Phenylobacterium sp. TaxID=1871053 RepID=UPI0025D9ECF7|nr:ActS/PrrB/RegB family redox-sensitive histidine kinase [Phenylobacterium sp.]MCG9915475.1 ActS/PrrB/RegB family redox-sensitive histidine kinase [Phenylobacterium sp.]